MPDFVYGILLVLLGLLPSFSLKNQAEADIKNMIAPKTSQAQVSDYSEIPVKNNNFLPNKISSSAGIFVDVESGQILLEKNKDQKFPMASTTKMMTAILVKEKLPLDKVVSVGSFSTRPLDTTMGISVGDRLTVRELLHGLLIQSGSDAAIVLAKEVSGSEQQFVALMNEKADRLGLLSTQFTNSVGYDDINHYSTAYDLAKLGKVFLLNKDLAEIASKRSYNARSEDGKVYFLANTNLLLNGSTYKGIKTGTTYAAGECLVSYYENSEQKIIGVLLNSPARFSETANIIQWTKEAFLW